MIGDHVGKIHYPPCCLGVGTGLQTGPGPLRHVQSAVALHGGLEDVVEMLTKQERWILTGQESLQRHVRRQMGTRIVCGREKAHLDVFTSLIMGLRAIVLRNQAQVRNFLECDLPN